LQTRSFYGLDEFFAKQWYFWCLSRYPKYLLVFYCNIVMKRCTSILCIFVWYLLCLLLSVFLVFLKCISCFLSVFLVFKCI
jgi:hypothetical protein